MNVREFVGAARARLEPVYGAREALSMIRILCRSVLEVPDYVYLTEPDREIGPEAAEVLMVALEHLSAGEPLQYILGKAEFCGLEFGVSPSVLIPRPETELLCRIILEEMVPQLRAHRGPGQASLEILDLCTGSGCIAWTLAHFLPDSKVTGADLSEEALAIASSQRIGGNAPEFVRCDVLDGLADAFAGRTFDMIVSNPPYVRLSEKALMQKNVLDYEPGMALFVPDEDPLVFYRAIAAFASGHLAPSGCVAVEINEAFGAGVRDLFISSGFADAVVRRDLSGRDRYVISGLPGQV